MSDTTFEMFKEQPSQIMLDSLVDSLHAKQKPYEHSITLADMFKLAKLISEHSLVLSFDKLSKILDLNVSNAGGNTNLDLKLRKLKLFLSIPSSLDSNEKSLFAARFLKESQGILALNKNGLKVQREIINISRRTHLLSPQSLELLCYDALHPAPAIALQEITLISLELDSWSLSESYGVPLKNMSDFLNSFQNYIKNHYPSYLITSDIKNDKNFNMYFSDASFAACCASILKQQLEKKNSNGRIGLKIKMFDSFLVAFEKQKLEDTLTPQSSPPIRSTPKI